MLNYWQTQTDQPLFGDLLWSKPEHKAQAGTLGIVGGSKSAFSSISFADEAARATGIGDTKIVAPTSLKPYLKSLPNVVFGDANSSGGFAKTALPTWQALQAETSATLLVGDLGKNPETVSLLNQFLIKSIPDKPIIITRDAVDLCLNNPQTITSLAHITAVMSFSQLQKLFRKILYPIVLTHSTQTAKLVEALHKFTITYPPTLVVYHQDQMLVAQSGRIVSTKFANSLQIWQGKTAATIASWTSWTPTKPLEGAITALYQQSTEKQERNHA